MDRIRVEKWFCFEVRTAAMFCGILGLISSLILIILPPIIVLVFKDTVRKSLREGGVSEDLIYMGVAVFVVCGLLGLFLYIFLLIGIQKNQSGWMLPYIIIGFIGNLSACFGMLRNPFSLPVIGFNIYTFIAVWSHYLNVQESQRSTVNALNVEKK